MTVKNGRCKKKWELPLFFYSQKMLPSSILGDDKKTYMHLLETEDETVEVSLLPLTNVGLVLI
jgi:hypothetical protein